MKKWLKRIIAILVILTILLICAFQLFMYKINNGIAKPQTEKHNIEIPQDRPTILLFSKTTGFRHSESINASKLAFPLLAKKNRWYIYETEDAGIFNEEELNKFDVVIWNNSTGVCLTDEQRLIFENYIENGGTYIGIHGSGDSSHHWDWYLNDIIGANFSHHPIKNHIQSTEVKLQEGVDSLISNGLQSSWLHSDEWYVFYNSPLENGFKIIYEIDGSKIDPSGNMGFMVKDKDFGMGKSHPVAWYKNLKKGKVFYTSMGHQSITFSDDNFIKLIENAIVWGLSE